jgi:nucleoside diphosphate kinase
MYNVVHGSNSPESGARQIKIFFPELVYRSAPVDE